MKYCFRYRQDQRLQDQLTSLKDELARADYTLRSMFGRSSFDGKNSVEKVLETFRLVNVAFQIFY